MPGLSQLKKLSEDVLRLGNEPKLRAERGEKPVLAQIPPSVQDIDDSEDFVLGMPEKDSDSPESNSEGGDSAALDQEALNSANAELEALLAGKVPGGAEPDFSNILNPAVDADGGIPDLSAFEEVPPAPEEAGPSIADMSLDDLLNMPSEDFSEPEPLSAEPAESESSSPVSEIPQSGADFSSGDMAESFDSAADDEFSFSGDGIDMTADIPSEFQEFPSPAENVTDGESDSVSVTVSDEVPSSGGSDFDAIDTGGLDDFGGMDSLGDDFGSDSGAGDNTGADSSSDFGSDFSNSENFDDAASFDLDSSMEADFSDSGENAGLSGEGDSDFENSDFDPSSIDLSGLNIGDDAGFDSEQGGGVPAGEENQTPEVFDTSQMEGINFEDLASGNSSLSDFNIPDTDSQLNNSSDFELDESGASEPDFEILGYTGENANPFDKNGRMKTQIPDSPEEHRKNSLTDAEYKKFKSNLQSYPLNVRIAVEDMIVKNEFTDDVVFEVIDKILKKVPARQLASHLEKMLDIQLSVPRDFERRTAEEYEAYKASIQYQLKNKIIPGILLGIMLFLVGFCSVYLGIEYIVKPVKAENLYRQGYALLENDEYPQSEIKFSEALKLKQKKKWFFKYANGYREHKQYDRATLMYKNILMRFNHDKNGGLEYARMELEDLANYARAEEIVKREILDYHVNDIDAMLLLGDIYLEWATEEDSSKLFQAAYNQYSNLMQLPKAPVQCNARMMLYNVRTDNLKGVLTYKELFYPDEKSLSGAEWTEMSGYLMDKLYGDLTPQEEYLRDSIEDVHSMLIRAIKKDPSNPISRYNIARYYLESGDHTKASENLTKTLSLFDNAKTIKKRDTYKQINTYRLLGEQYLYNRDFILAQKTLADGIELFEEKNASSGFESDKNVGIMYSDMADIDYFVSGDLENAERNYENAVNNKNDTPSIRYRVGYINYSKNNYDKAFSNFMTASGEKDNDTHLLLALANTLSLKDDNFAAAGYYQKLLDSLDLQISRSDILLPQVNDDDGMLVDQYMKASNNLGVSQFKIAKQTGSSSLNGESLNNLQNSLRAWDALTRNQKSMVRLGGTNLAEQNIRYIVSPLPAFEPAIYTEIPRILENEKVLE
ncbi:MAG: periplasmic flagellar collar protein FlcA [Treponema sp.]